MLGFWSLLELDSVRKDFVVSLAHAWQPIGDGVDVTLLAGAFADFYRTRQMAEFKVLAVFANECEVGGRIINGLQLVFTCCTQEITGKNKRTQLI